MASATLTDQALDKAKQAGNQALGRAKEAVESVEEMALQAAAAVGHKADDLTAACGHEIKEAGDALAHKLPQSGLPGKASHVVTDTLHESGRYIEEAKLSGIAHDVAQVVRNHPMPAMLICFGIGFCLGRVMKD
jgi:ElaB/YqjD/DUF883 family membrane-anchored ribosome-binding protein